MDCLLRIAKLAVAVGDTGNGVIGMKCVKCGYSVPEDSEFCQYCGAKIEIEADNDESAITQQATEPVMPQEQEPVEAVADEVSEVDTDANGDTAQAAAPDTTSERVDDVLESEETSDKEETAKSEEDLKITVSDNASTQKEKSAKKKQTYCKRCGGLIDQEKKKCQGCGKQYFRIPKHLGAGILAAICMVLIGLNIFQYTQTISIKQELEQATSTISAREKTISDQKGTISNQKKTISDLNKDVAQYRERWYDSFPKAMFMDEHVVIVGNSNNKYHKYGCEDLDLSYFYAYNTENAIAQGYRACSKCN